MNVNKIRRVDFSPDEWIAGTLGLSLEEEGLYIKICVLIWSAGGRITEEHLKGCTSAHGNKVNALLRSLEKAGKIVRNGREIGQKRAEKELENAQKRVGKYRENGAKGGRPNGLEEPAGYFPRARPRNHQPSTINYQEVPPSLGPPPKATAARQKPRRQFPPDWQPDDQDVAFALREGQDTGWIAVQAERCRDFHRAKGNLFADLRAAWRTWVRKAGEIEQSRMAKLNGKQNAHDEETAAFERVSRLFAV